MLPWQILLWQLKSVPINLFLKFRQNRVSNSWDIANIEFLWWGVRGQPNRGYKKPNPNPNISSMIFGSYNRIRIVQKGIRFLINRIPNIGFLCSVYKKPNSWFKPNYSFEPNIRIFVPNIDRIIRFNRIMSNFTGNLVISWCSATFF